jgi:Putative DNA-binding domain
MFLRHRLSNGLPELKRFVGGWTNGEICYTVSHMPGTEIDIVKLISEGESPSVEFRTRYPGSNTVARYLTAFANSQGGILVVGVGPGRNIVGLDEREAEITLSRIHRVAGTVLPLGTYKVGVASVHGKIVAYAEVSAVNRASLRRKIANFSIESILVLGALSCSAYLVTSPGMRNNVIGRLFSLFVSEFSFPVMVWSDLTILFFFALVFYGTAYEVTPLKLLVPFSRVLFKKRSTKTDETETAHVTSSEALTVTENASAPSQAKGQDMAEKLTVESETGREDDPSDTAADDNTDVMLAAVSERARFLANRMESRTNTYMIVGVFMGLCGMLFWFLSLRNVLSGQTTLTQFIEVAIPRVTILLFIELLAGFFLRQYRIGVEDFKYFFEIEQSADWKRISHRILKEAQEPAALVTLASTLITNLGPTKLGPGESTPALETIKAEGNVALEAMKLMTSTVMDVSKALRKGGK